jgi:hypothetical protein
VIVVNVNKTWPHVLSGRMDAEDSVLGYWPIAEHRLQECDVVLASYNNVIVAAYDINGHERTEENKVAFDGEESKDWAHLIGKPTPATPWGRQGDAWPVRYIDTAVVAGGDVPVEQTPTGRRAVIEGFTFTIGDDGNATVVLPAGRTLMVLTS